MLNPINIAFKKAKLENRPALLTYTVAGDNSKKNSLKILGFKEQGMNEFALLDEKEGIPLFYPYIAPETKDQLLETINSRWIGQGPKVDKFEQKFKKV